MPVTHDKIIAHAAKGALQPFGFRRKGQSRLWLADHGWWLTVVEFQPSGFSKGSYLNVAAHWLWSDLGFISFDFGDDRGIRAAGFVEYVADDQFQVAADRLAAAAAQRARRLARQLYSIEATAELLLGRESSPASQGGGSWLTYHAGVAAGLAGREEDARAMLLAVTDERVKGAAERFVDVLPDAARFKGLASSLIVTQRQKLRLPAVNPALS